MANRTGNEVRLQRIYDEPTPADGTRVLVERIWPRGVRAVGLTWPPQSEEALIGEAHLICYDLSWGWAPQQIADDIHAHMNARGVTLLDVGTMVNAAHSTYCPGNVCDAPSLCT